MGARGGGPAGPRGRLSPWLRGAWLVALVLGARRPPPKVPSIEDGWFIKACVDVHNELRAKVDPAASNMRYMSWDAALARTARAWSKKCVFKHNTFLGKKGAVHPKFRSVGENIWLGGVGKFNPKNAITAWYNEFRSYTYDTKRCTGVCGHYTQVVWAYTYKVGCAIRICPKLGGWNTGIFICNYSPAGNTGARPYKSGSPCSQCEEGDTCQDKQCRNRERDKNIGYPYWWYPKWETPRPITCDPTCIAMCFFRFLAIGLTVLISVLLYRKFPNITLRK
ncbi:GLIPR1-like protein 1 isoform X1 [Ornithorhynchus anatinus]|uniref:SCP domain-containing protein n=1 Tax=Ornithorhynchus anatinus TaxID=9258 RepID=A0A6I8PK87_ORNAN|nr:GLIPR1-like protein 1 isoform X1 [Ornithorhynchus anatinus]